MKRKTPAKSVTIAEQSAGNQTRFIRLPSADVLTPDVEELIAAAVAQAKTPPRASGKGQLIIRSISAKQRPRRKMTRLPLDYRFGPQLHATAAPIAPSRSDVPYCTWLPATRSTCGTGWIRTSSGSSPASGKW